MTTLILKIILFNSILLFSLMGNADTRKERILQLKNEIKRVLQEMNIDTPIGNMDSPDSIPTLQQEEKALSEFLFSLNHIKFPDTSLFDVKEILVDASDLRNSGGLKRSRARNGKMYLYIPINQNNRHMLQRLSDKPYVELTSKKIAELKANEEQLGDITKIFFGRLRWNVIIVLHLCR